MNKKKIFAIILGITISSLTLVSCSSNINTKRNENKTTTSDNKNKEDSNEALQSNITNNESTPPINNAEIATVESVVAKNIANYKDNVSVYYYNLKTGAEYNYNADKKYMGASMRKLPVAISIADDIHSGKLSLDTLLYYNKDTDFQGGSGILQSQKEIKPTTIKYALELSMKYSDNIAHRMLRRTASKAVAEYTTFVSGEEMIDPEISPRQMASLYKRLYSNPDKNPHYDYIIDLLKNTIYHDRLDKYLPYDKVAHKIGDYYRYFHDSAIVFSDNPYILVVMTKDIGAVQPGDDDNDERMLLDDGDEACELSAVLSKELYDSLNEFYKKEN